MSRRVSLLPTGVANTRSVIEAFASLGATCDLVTSAEDVYAADFLVLPGVGSFGSGAVAVQALSQPLINRLEAGLPTLGICLGYQLLFESSSESPGANGLAFIPGTLLRFNGDLRVPQMGWNRVEAQGCRVLESGYAYFANSFAAETMPDDWSIARATYGAPFIAGIERGNIVGCQFHPELSGDFGLGVLERWLSC
ncbi:MAG TPA: imidazole glycerol phosphate synthase subunit HisH [Fimbriimonadaceae bacterium]|nr:imidazole glycerol phosphate synthase subunit HisH [Fimbriimonadaceae bacterium]